jgi:hypothetical protein
MSQAIAPGHAKTAVEAAVHARWEDREPRPLGASLFAEVQIAERNRFPSLEARADAQVAGKSIRT